MGQANSDFAFTWLGRHGTGLRCECRLEPLHPAFGCLMYLSMVHSPQHARQHCLIAVCMHRLAPCVSSCEWDDSPRVLPQPSTTASVFALTGNTVVWGRLLNPVLALLQSLPTPHAASAQTVCLFWVLGQCPHCPLLPCCSHKLLHLSSVCQQLSRSCAEPSRAQQSLSLSHTGWSMLPWQCTVCCTLGLQEPEIMVLLQH